MAALARGLVSLWELVSFLPDADPLTDVDVLMMLSNGDGNAPPINGHGPRARAKRRSTRQINSRITASHKT